jgi:hypothetical protein
VGARPGPRVARAPPRPEALAALADPPTIDPLVAAEIARLHHVNDNTPGITRERIGDGRDAAAGLRHGRHAGGEKRGEGDAAEQMFH